MPKTDNIIDKYKGNGCGYCLPGKPIEYVESKAGRVNLCLECVMRWFPGRSITWWEERHRPFLDHINEALKRDEEKREKDMLAAALA